MDQAKRCKAKSKRSGRQCKQAAVPGYEVCHYHGARRYGNFDCWQCSNLLRLRREGYQRRQGIRISLMTAVGLLLCLGCVIAVVRLLRS